MSNSPLILSTSSATCTTCSLQEYCGREDNSSMLGWGLGAQDREFIPCFWTSFPLPSTKMVLVMFVMYTIIATFSILGNGLVILLWIR